MCFVPVVHISKHSFCFQIQSVLTGLTKAKTSELTYRHAENALGVALQRAQQQPVLGCSHADGVVIRADQQDPPGSLLWRGQAAHTTGAVALKHILLFVGLNKELGGNDCQAALSSFLDEFAVIYE